jgi:hypothetical protein
MAEKINPVVMGRWQQRWTIGLLQAKHEFGIPNRIFIRI